MIPATQTPTHVYFAAPMADGKGQMELKIPLSLRLVKLSGYVDFLKCYQLLSETSAESPVNVAAVLARAVAAFSGCDAQMLANVKVGSMEPGKEFGLAKLFSICANAVGQHPLAKHDADAPLPYVFEHKGSKFSMPGYLRKSLGAGVVMPEMTVNEGIEAAEFIRQCELSDEQSGDADGSILFTKYLRTLAALARMPGEALPIDDIQRDVFLSERAALFQDIDAATALDAAFFLTSSFNLQKLAQNAVGFLSGQSIALAGEIQKLSAPRWKRGPDSNRIRKARLIVSAGGGSPSGSSSEAGLGRAERRRLARLSSKR